jgi:hypothetical protein
MQLDSHRWTIKMRGRIKVPSWAILIPTILFVSPSLIWLALDHSVWRFDQASYARDTLDLYRVLRGNPHHWPLAMLNAVVSKAPGMVWFGQFFLPLRYMLKSPEAALLTSICVCQIFALLFLVSALRNAFPKKGAIIYLAAILVTAASPIFIGLSQQYLVESSQIFAVSIFIWIVSHAHTRRADILFIELVTATAAAMMAKLTSPVYTCIFGIYILFKIIKNRGNAKRLPPVSLLERNVFFITCLIFITATLGWYFRNFRELWALSINSASGPMSLLYGHRLPFFSKMLLWLQVAEQSTFVKVFMPPIMILTVLGAWFGEKKMPVVPMLCVLQGGFFLAAASFQVNEDIRFFAPVLPSLTMVIAWVLSKQRKPLLASVLGIVLITQWGYLHGHALGLLHFDHRYTNYKWNGTYLSE